MAQSRRGVAAAVTLLMVLAASAVVFVQSKDQTATDFYMSYRATFEKAKSVDEVLPLMSKDVRAKIEATPKEERGKLFALLKEISKMSGVKVVKETRTADGVMLTVEGMQDKQTQVGQVQILKEGGQWKLGHESWSSKS